MYIQCNTQAHSCNHCHSGKAISITHSECVFIAFGIQYAMRMWHAVQLYSILLHSLINSTIKKVTEYKKMRVLIFTTTFIQNIFHSKKKWAKYDHKCL